MNKLKNNLLRWLIPLLIIIMISGCEDRDGITYPPTTTTPTVSSTNPADGAIEVPFNQQITATFSEEMNSSTITTASFTLMQGTSFVSGTVSYTGTTAAFAPSSNLSPNTDYTATITTTAKNLAGNGLAANYTWTFTTGSAPTVTPPTVSSTAPANTATDVPINQKIAATFSVAMDATTITSSTFTLLQGTTPISGFVSYSGITAIFAPTTDLMPNTVYTGIITTGAADLAGNALENNYVWSFTTGATAQVTPPTVILTDPANAETNVPLNQKVAATFSKTMDASTITSGTFTLRQGTTSVSGFTSYSGTTAIFSPASNLSPNTVYTATITTGAKDLAGNSLANNYVWSFTTGSSTVITPPTIISTDPIDGEIDVSVDKHVTATFSKPMDASTITTAVFTLMEAGFNSFISGTVSYSGTTATFVPLIDLQANTTYTATITTGAKDLTGNSMTNNYVWNFTTASTSYTVSLSSDPAEGGTTNGGGTYDDGASVTVSATPNSGYEFVNWTENGNEVSTNASYTFTINENRTLVANFNELPPNQYSVSLSSNPTEGGTTNGGGTYDDGASVTVSATPNSGYEFVNWTENGNEVSTNASYTFTINENRTLVANFNELPPNQYSVSLSSNPAEGGTTNGGGTYDDGASVTVSATPNSGYEFVNWTENGNEVSANASYTFTINENRTLVANFNELPPNQYSVSLSSNPAEGGTTNGGGTYDDGASVTVSATPNSGYEFVNWTENGNEVSANASYTFTINENRTLVANFNELPPNQYSVSLSSNPAEGGTTNGGGTYDDGASVTVSATPNSGYEFVNWTENGNEVSANASYTFTINENRTLVANFNELPPNQYLVSLSSNPAEGGTTNGDGTYDEGASVTVSATPNSGYEFVNWTENGNEVSTNASYTFTIIENRTLTANFSSTAPIGPDPVDLGSAGDFAILAGSGVTNTGFTFVYGDVGSFPTATIDGFPPGVVDGTLYMTADPIVGTAKDDLTTAYNDAQSRSLDAISLPGQLGGLTLAPGLYVNSSTTGISGTGPQGILTLDAGGNPNAVWIFKMGSTLITDPGTSIVLAGGAKWENIYWSVGTSATLGTNSQFYGNILADQSISLNTGASLRGRALTRVAAVSLDTSVIDKR